MARRFLLSSEDCLPHTGIHPLLGGTAKLKGKTFPTLLNTQYDILQWLHKNVGRKFMTANGLIRIQVMEDQLHYIANDLSYWTDDPEKTKQDYADWCEAHKDWQPPKEVVIEETTIEWGGRFSEASLYAARTTDAAFEKGNLFFIDPNGDIKNPYISQESCFLTKDRSIWSIAESRSYQPDTFAKTFDGKAFFDRRK